MRAPLRRADARHHPQLAYPFANDLGRCADQTAQHRFLFDNLRVIINVRSCRHGIGQLRQITDAADFLQLVPVLQMSRQRYQIDRLVASPSSTIASKICWCAGL